MNVVLRTLLFVVLSVAFLIGFISFYAPGHTDAEVGKLSPWLIALGSMLAAALVTFGPLAVGAIKNQRQNAVRLDQRTAATRGYIENSGTIPHICSDSGVRAALGAGRVCCPA
jgi:hypothetical protein